MNLSPFHLAIPVRDIAEAREFYGKLLGFTEGRSAQHWIDWNLFGHQLVTHLAPQLCGEDRPRAFSSVDGHQVPVPHFGVVLPFEEWQAFARRIEPLIDPFLIAPTIRFAGQPGEQGTLFFTDPSGNALEFKGFRDIESRLFAV